MGSGEKLALNGGARAVTSGYRERWPMISEDDVNRAARMMIDGELSIADGSGVLEEFEGEFARYHGVPYALVQNNGTSALHAAYFAVGVGPGDEVLVPTYSWPSTENAALTCNATPVFCDVDPDTLCIDPAEIERKITPATRAIGVVHLWGQPAAMDAILDIARQHHLHVIEDCSHAHGATYKGHKVGSIGEIGCFSLQASKMIVGGEAGVAITGNPLYFDRMLALSHYGGRVEKDLVEQTYRPFAYTGLGPKYRVHPLAAAIALGQIRHLDEWIAMRGANLSYLSDGLRGLPGVRPPHIAQDTTRGAYYGYRVRYLPRELGDLGCERFIDALRAEGVDAQPERYRLLHREPLYRGQRYYQSVTGYRWPYAPIREIEYDDSDFPVAASLIDNLIALPTFTGQCRELLDQYIAAFRKVTTHYAA